MTTPMLAPVRRPPHDPLSLLLNVRTGWPVLAAASISVGQDVMLVRDPATLSWPTDPTGSFGGLRLPDNVAVGEDGRLWLLDRRTGWLKRFEACDCAFVPARKLGTEGYGAIAECAGRLFVTQGAWLKVLALPTTALAAKWRPAAPYDDWQPTGVAVDQHRQVHVADPNHGVLHTFSWTGRHLGVVPGIGASTHLAVALDGSVYAAGDTPGVSPVYQVAGGSATPVTASSDDLAPLLRVAARARRPARLPLRRAVLRATDDRVRRPHRRAADRRAMACAPSVPHGRLSHPRASGQPRR